MGKKRHYKRNRTRRFGRPHGRHSFKFKFTQKPSTGDMDFSSRKKYRIISLSADRLKLILKKDVEMGTTHKYSVSRTVHAGGKIKMFMRKISPPRISGYRLIQVNKLTDHINKVSSHIVNCSLAREKISFGLDAFQLLPDKKQNGLAATVLGQCLGCEKFFKLETSEKIETSDCQKHYDVNMRAVLGTMASGGGSASLEQQCATLDLPGLSKKSFSKIENDIGRMWESTLHEDLLQAGALERKLAMERNDFHQGVPSITVVCDGGWSKRSHKHSYNALGGVAIIVGAVTGQLLYMGVRNKYCSICAVALHRGQDPPDHTCFKNWNDSSQSMEADIIVNGFLEAERMHGLRYMRLIGDGDSSVFARIQEGVPIWGKEVEKIECANHICKCLRTKLEKLATDNPDYKGRNKLTKKTRIHLVSTVRRIIKHHASTTSVNEQNKKATAEKLANEIRNSIKHCFNDHTNCSSFCKAKTVTDASQKPPESHTDITSSMQKELSQKDDDTNVIDDVNSVFDSAVAFWSEGVSAEDLTAASYQQNTLPLIPSDQLYKDLYVLINSVALKADRLLSNATTNLAENWMLIRMKFNGGKIFNRCNRGSWNFRCYGAGLRKNFGADWSPFIWEKVTGTEAGSVFHEKYRIRKVFTLQSLESKSTTAAKELRWKRKYGSLQQSQTKKAKQDYGEEAIDVVPDIPPEELTIKMDEYYNTHVNVTEQMMINIENETKSQSLSGLWSEERRKRLTASNFGAVVKRKPGILVKCLVQRLLYSSFSGTRLTRRGLRLERFAIIEYKNHRRRQGENVEVEQMGLFISRQHPFLAASTDGKVQSDVSGSGLLEIKHVLMNKTTSLEEAASRDKSFCLQLEQSQLKLKTNHAFYHQVQGQLNVMQYPWLDFVVRRVDPHQLHVERILRDEQFWKTCMVPKLEAFYKKAILPELTAPRYGKSPGIREPGLWYTSDAVVARKRKIVRAEKTCSGSTSEISSEDSSQIHAPRAGKRKHVVKFLNRYVSHEWIDEFGRSDWFNGHVVDILHGVDGASDCVYEILYDDCEDPYEVDHLVEDFNDNSVKFLDV